jgi:hypothetical protein
MFLAALALSVSAFNVTGPTHVDLYVQEQQYATQRAHYTVPRAQSVPVKVDVIYTLTFNGWTGIENTSLYQWPVSDWWVGVISKLKHTGGTTFSAAATDYGWSSSTTQAMGTTYNNTVVGPPKPFDGTVDWLGDSGRSWQIRGQRVVTQTLTGNLAAWTAGDAQGLHHIDLTLTPTGGFTYGPPTSHWRGWADGYVNVAMTVRYQY